MSRRTYGRPWNSSSFRRLTKSSSWRSRSRQRLLACSRVSNPGNLPTGNGPEETHGIEEEAGRQGRSRRRSRGEGGEGQPVRAAHRRGRGAARERADGLRVGAQGVRPNVQRQGACEGAHRGQEDAEAASRGGHVAARGGGLAEERKERAQEAQARPRSDASVRGRGTCDRAQRGASLQGAGCTVWIGGGVRVQLDHLA